MRKIWFYILLTCASPSLGQNEDDVLKYIQIFHPQFQQMHYRTQIEDSKIYFKVEQATHSGVKPMISFTELENTDAKLYWNKEWNKKSQKDGKEITKFRFSKIYPIADIGGGVDIGSSLNPVYTGGIGVGLDFSSPKIVLTAKGLPYYTSSGYFQDSIQTNFDMDLGTNRSIAANLFYKSELYAAYRPNKFFTLIGGYGKNFFGEGYRSVLLSDNIGAHPFFKIETSFAGIKYVNLYNFWRDNSVDPFDRSLDIPKFTSTHYLSWNITKDINLSIFEAVIFQSNDTLVNRGFDFNYINPIVFYRPVEYGLGSSDNVLVGANLGFKLNENHHFYSQFVLDEFLLSEIRAHSRWWANKYGWQVGYKSNQFFAENLYFQLEFNGVRPFTYSHKFSQHAYGHMNAAAAHPIGANFMEVLNILSYQKGKHRITNKLTFAAYGVDDSDTVSFGQNIFASYTLRPGTYDQLLFQGVRTNVLNETFVYEYELIRDIDLYLTAAYNWRMANTSMGTDHFHTFSIGLKSRIWNSYSDF